MAEQDPKLEENGLAGSDSINRLSPTDEQIQPSESVSSHGTIDRYGFIRRSNACLPGDDPDKSEVDGQEDEPDVTVVRRRETKWIEMLKNWNSYMTKDYEKVRSRCRKGIPGSIRPEAWLYLCGAKFMMDDPGNKGKFEQLRDSNGPNKWDDDIEKDLHRNFPTHELFGGCYERIGQRELFNVLRAYSIYNPTDGYCQAQAPVAALLLMNMPAEQAFWCLVSICDRYLPKYYSPGMRAIQLDAAILMGLLKRVSTAAYKHLKKQEVEPLMFMTEWFLCVFTRTLPWGSVLRVWDMFMCEGVKVIFKVGLVILKHTLTKEVISECPTMYETLTVLKDLPNEVTCEEFLLPKICQLTVDQAEMKKEHKKQLKKRAKIEGESVGSAAAKASQPEDRGSIASPRRSTRV